MRRPSEIEQLIEPLFVGLSYELFGVTVSSAGQHSVVQVFIDKPGGVTIEDITTISRQISAFLDVEGPLTGRYTLEVSSPGLDRALFKPEHFAKQVGTKIQISLSYPVKSLDNEREQKNFKGTLQKIEGDSIYLLLDSKSKNLVVQPFSFEQIDKARVIPEFEKRGVKKG